MQISDRFEAYTEFDPSVPVWCITPPELSGCIHRFFDTSPVSPSGRYVALTRLPDETGPPGPGEEGEVVLVDLETGEVEVVACTRGFDTQLGAQTQWGRTDEELYFNDMDTEDWRPYAVRLDPRSGTRTELDGPVYMVSPDGTKLASPCLLRAALTQGGYGVIAPPTAIPHNETADRQDGLYLTDAKSGKCSLFVSFAEIRDGLDEVREDLEGGPGALYGFHVKWNPQGTRLMFVIRWRPTRDRKLRAYVVTMNADGSDIRLAMPASVWARGGHHPNWCPDGEYILQNLKVDGAGLQFVQYRYDGSDLHVLGPGVVGGGHPTMHPDGRHILTDAYLHESVAFGDGTTPIRWVDIEAEADETLVRIRTLPLEEGPLRVLRVDPHPAWDRDFRRVVFNACPDGKRRVYLADPSSLVPGEPGA